jgi:hypothetical protein
MHGWETHGLICKQLRQHLALQCTARTQVRTCTIASPTECNTGEVCVASNKCFQLQCSGTTLATTDCATGTGLCAPAVRKPISASFTSSGDTIMVTLNAPARPSIFPCSKLFANDTTVLGAEALCMADGTSLEVHLAASATLIPGGSLAISDVQQVLVDALAPAYFNGSIAVNACSGSCSPAAPNVVLMAPAVRSFWRV